MKKRWKKLLTKWVEVDIIYKLARTERNKLNGTASWTLKIKQ